MEYDKVKLVVLLREKVVCLPYKLRHGIRRKPGNSSHSIAINSLKEWLVTKGEERRSNGIASGLSFNVFGIHGKSLI